MQEQNGPLQTLEDIKLLMNNSSRFISLSGLSGVAAGLCALLATFAVWRLEPCLAGGTCLHDLSYRSGTDGLFRTLAAIGIITFGVAAILAFFFTYLRSRKTGVAIWGLSARRVMFNVLLPMLAGGFLILRMMQASLFGLIAPSCLIFYGLALINASKFTLPEIRYLGYFQLFLGILNLWFTGYGLFFWAFGFGVLHILYGLLMWNKYERNQEPQA